MSEPPHVLLRFYLHRIDECIICGILEWYHHPASHTVETHKTYLAACEHEILPYEDTDFIAHIVENVWLIDASTPDTDHVLVPGGQKPEPLRVFVIRKPTAVIRVRAERSKPYEPCQEAICRDPVGSYNWRSESSKWAKATSSPQTSHKDGDAVDFKVPRQALLVDERLLYDLDAPESNCFDHGI